MPFKTPANRKAYFAKKGYRKGQRIKIDLRVPKKTDIKDDVRFVGVHRKRRFLLDKDIPAKFRKHTLLHEAVEDEIEKEKIPYHTAHKISERFERNTFPYGKHEWKRYSKIVDNIHKENVIKGVKAYRTDKR